MPPAPIPHNEPERLRALDALQLLDTPPEERFDRISRLATRVLGAPIAYVSLVAGERQWYKSSCGLDGLTETPRSLSFCAHTVLQEDTVVVEDATYHPLFHDNPFVTGQPGVRFYMGHPLKTLDGYNVGTFCVLDLEPQSATDEKVAQLRDLAAMAQTELNLVDVLHLQEQLVERNQFIRNVLGRYVTDEVADVVLSSPGALQLGGVRRTVTVMMSDLRSFTPMAEHLPPEQVVEVLNRYLARMVDVILEHGGTIDEIIGDAILVIFGAPLEVPDSAARAVACAVAMQKAMAAVNEENRRAGLPELEMGVGINTGEVVVGNIGSSRRMKYSVVGSPVNLTARIESFTVGGQVLISESTRRAVGPILRVDGSLRVNVKGLSRAITIYDVGGIGGRYGMFLPAQEADAAVS